MGAREHTTFLEMPVDMTYESDSEDDQPKTQSGLPRSPSFDDSEAFPETLGGASPVRASAVPNFAGLAASFQVSTRQTQTVRKPIRRLLPATTYNLGYPYGLGHGYPYGLGVGHPYGLPLVATPAAVEEKAAE